MKHIKAIVMTSLFVLCLLIGDGISYAYDPLPNGFRNMHFGDSLQTVQQQYDVTYEYYDKSTNSVAYVYKFPVGDSISGVPLDNQKAILLFWNNKLWGIIIGITREETNENFSTLLDAMKLRFGIALPMKLNEKTWGNYMEAYGWENNKTGLMLIKYPQSSVIGIFSAPFLHQILMENARSGW